MRAHKCLLLTVLMVIMAAATCWGELVITGLQGSGELSVTGLWTNASYRVEWASSLTGQWFRSWEHLEKLPTRTNTAATVSVPMFYRVVMAGPPDGMVVVPGGTFQMGWSGVATPVHQVTLSSFYLAEHEMAYGLWYEVKSWAETNGYSFVHPGREGRNGADGAVPTSASNEPVTMISWRDAIVWCNARSEKEELSPVYTFGQSAITDANDDFVCDVATFDTTADGYRLPTEAEWEYVARYQDGSTWTPGDYASGATNDYNDAAACRAVAWYSANGGLDTHPVGEKNPNQLVIYDMSGNVREWCWDWWVAYGAGGLTNPIGPPSGTNRVVRGGDFTEHAWTLRCAERGIDIAPDFWSSGIGFRCARGL